LQLRLTQDAFDFESADMSSPVAGNVPSEISVEMPRVDVSEDECVAAAETSPPQNDVGCCQIFLTLLHFVTVECRPLFLIWLSGIGIVTSIVFSGQLSSEQFVNAGMLQCMESFAFGVVFYPGAAVCSTSQGAARVMHFSPDGNVDGIRYSSGRDNSWSKMCDCPDQVTGTSMKYLNSVSDLEPGESPPIGRRAMCLSNATNTALPNNQFMPGTNSLTSTCGGQTDADLSYEATTDRSAQWYWELSEFRPGWSSTTQAFGYGCAIHGWLFVMLALRLYLWSSDTEARDYRTGAYIGFNVELEHSQIHKYSVYGSCVGCGVLALTPYVLGHSDNIQAVPLLSSILLMMMGLKSLLNTAPVVIDTTCQAFRRAEFSEVLPRVRVSKKI